MFKWINFCFNRNLVKIKGYSYKFEYTKNQTLESIAQNEAKKLTFFPKNSKMSIFRPKIFTEKSFKTFKKNPAGDI